jgi:uncharacterized membrane protein YhiD involved in acid resistance
LEAGRERIGMGSILYCNTWVSSFTDLRRIWISICEGVLASDVPSKSSSLA